MDPILTSTEDTRDYLYLPLEAEFPASFDLKPDVFEVDNQYSVGSCVSNALTSACEALLKRSGRGLSLSRLFNYWTARNLIQGKTDQTGTNIRSALQAASGFGLPPETAWPYDESKAESKPSDPAFLEASSHKVTRYEQLFYGIRPSDLQLRLKAIKSALSEGLPVVFAMRLGSRFQSLSGDWRSQGYVKIGTNGNTSVGYHAMLIIGYDDASETLLVENSWGPNWGDGGFGGIPYSVFASDVFEAWVVREFDGVKVERPAPVPVPVPEPTPEPKPEPSPAPVKSEDKSKLPYYLVAALLLLLSLSFFGII